MVSQFVCNGSLQRPFALSLPNGNGRSRFDELTADGQTETQFAVRD